jgi:hypothetical protein
MIKKVLLFVIWFFCGFASAQDSAKFSSIAEKNLIFKEWNIDTSFVSNNNSHKDIWPNYNYTLNGITTQPINNILGYIYNLNLGLKRKHFIFEVFPIKSTAFGYDSQEKKSYLQASTGVHTNLDIKNKFFVSYNLVYNKGTTPAYFDSVISKTGTMPGQGLVKIKGTNSYEWHQSFGFIAYKPNKVFTFEGGIGKHFLGDGSRSLLLSDNASNYPYFKILTKVWKLNYMNLYAQFNENRFSNFNGTQAKKYAAIHYLSWEIVKWCNFSFFESIVFQDRSKGRGLGFDINYLNPLVFYRPIEYSLGSPDNALMGANINFKINKNYLIYSQILLDEFSLKYIRARNGWSENKQSYQIGVRYIEKFYKATVNASAELNIVRPYTYSHRNIYQNYAHLNQGLAHVYGANFYEMYGRLNITNKRAIIVLNLVNAVIGLDGDSLKEYSGNNIYRGYVKRPQDFNNFITQGIKTRLLIADITYHYILNPNLHFTIYGGVLCRYMQNIYSKQFSVIPSIGLRTTLQSIERIF